MKGNEMKRSDGKRAVCEGTAYKQEPTFICHVFLNLRVILKQQTALKVVRDEIKVIRSVCGIIYETNSQQTRPGVLFVCYCHSALMFTCKRVCIY